MGESKFAELRVDIATSGMPNSKKRMWLKALTAFDKMDAMEGDIEAALERSKRRHKKFMRESLYVLAIQIAVMTAFVVRMWMQ